MKRLKIGMTENDVATEVVYQIKQAGGDGYSFYPGIICVGNGSDPNRDIMTRNTNMRLASGTTVAFDFGVLYQGYCSDFGRSVFVGNVPPAALDAYRCITQGAQAVWELMGDGKIAPYQTQEFMVARTAAEGFGDYYYKWGLGHGIGLDVHEDPWLRVGFTEPIRAGMCFHGRAENLETGRVLRPLRGCGGGRQGPGHAVDEVSLRSNPDRIAVRPMRPPIAVVAWLRSGPREDPSS